MPFDRGEEVEFLKGGSEISARIVSVRASCGPGWTQVDHYDIQVEGESEQRRVKPTELLPRKKPGFEVRDLALVIGENRIEAQGEVIKIGAGPKGRKFYQLKFEIESGSTRRWYSEDQVFLLSISNEDNKERFDESLVYKAPHLVESNDFDLLQDFQ